ncbi:hypothetical protein Tco_1384530 [Tanacetum coccineum]
MVERDYEIKILGEINVELDFGTNKLIRKLSHKKDSQEEALEEFNSTLDNVLENLSHEKDIPNDSISFMYDTNNDASISGKSKVVFDPLVHEEVMEMANDQAEGLSDQEVAYDCLDDKHVEEIRTRKRIRVKRWSRMKIQRKVDKDLLMSLDTQAFYAKESPIPPQDPITPSAILTPSSVLPPSLLFDHRYFFVPEELLPPKKQIHPASSSSTTLSNSSWKQAHIPVPPSFPTYTPTSPQIYKLGKSSIKMRVKYHEEQIESILEYLEELSFHYIEKIEERLVNN